MKYKTFAFLALCFPLVSLAGNPQTWIQSNTNKKLGDDFSVGMSQENRIGTKEGQHIDEIHIVPSISYVINEHIDIGLNYRHVLLRDKTDTRYSNDHRPGLDLTFKDSVYSWKMSNRSRFICRKPEEEQEFFRYRNLSKIVSPWKFTSLEINPFGEYEWYYDEGSKDREYRKNDRFSIQWLTFGFNFKICSRFKPAIWYRLTENKDRIDHNWEVGHVIGMSLNIAF